MSINLNQEEERIADNLIDKKGILVHTVEPSRESKGMWSEIYLVDGTFYNRAYGDTQDAWMVFIEKLESSEELTSYMTEDEMNQILENHSLK